MFRAIPVLAAAVFALVVGAAPAAADEQPRVSLGLTVSHSAFDGSPSGTYVGTLTCNPNGGIHQSPDAACAELISANGNIEATEQESTVFCPLHYAPVTVRAFGWYEGSLVDYTQTYGNACVFAATTGALWNI